MSRGFYTLHDSGHVRHFEVTSACVSRALKFPTLGGPPGRRGCSRSRYPCTKNHTSLGMLSPWVADGLLEKFMEL